MAAALLLVIACRGAHPDRSDPPPSTSKPNAPRALLRIRNVGTKPIQQFIVVFPAEQLQFGVIVAGETTDYQQVMHGVFGGAAMGYVLNGKKMAPFAVDPHFGEPLSGAFTYEVDVQRHLHNEYVRLTEVVRDNQLPAEPSATVTH